MYHSTEMVNDYKTHLSDASIIVEQLIKDAETLPHNKVDQLQEIVHELSEESSCFNEIKLASESRKLDVKLSRMRPEEKQKVESRSFLNSFHDALMDSRFLVKE